MTPLEATVVVDFDAVVVHIVIVVVTLFVVIDNIEVKSDNLRLLKAKVEFLSGWVGGVLVQSKCTNFLRPY